METVDILIVGAGAAGMAAALAAAREGASVCVAERDSVTGGILNQCIHHGFGLGYFGEDLTGPDYAKRFQEKMLHAGLSVLTDTTVLSLSPDRTALLTSPTGLRQLQFSHCILAAGCRERSIGSLPVGGTRPAGVFTAGAAQRMLNLGHYRIGSSIVILGSGDMGQILSRRLSILGCRIVAMVEKKDRPGGIARNRRECLDAYHIPLILSATIDELHGQKRLSGVTVRHLDSGEREFLPCDTLITALGLIPERELAAPLTRDGAVPSWLHFCGNCDYVHEFVDNVSQHAEVLGTRLAHE